MPEQAAQNDLTDYAWYQPNAVRKTPPSDKKRPNNWDWASDMSGNVWEWVTRGQETNAAGTLRGGSWQDEQTDLEAGRQGWVEPILRTRMVGFRVVLSIDPATRPLKRSEN